MNRPPYPVAAIVYSPDGALSTAELAAFAKDATQWIGDVVAPWWARCMSFRAVDPTAALDPVMPQIAFAHHEQVVGALRAPLGRQGRVARIGRRRRLTGTRWLAAHRVDMKLENSWQIRVGTTCA